MSTASCTASPAGTSQGRPSSSTAARSTRCWPSRSEPGGRVRRSTRNGLAKWFGSALFAAAAILFGATAARAAGAIVVASKIDTEGALLGQMIAAALEARGLPVERKIQLGPTNIVRAALLAGQIDLYPE